MRFLPEAWLLDERVISRLREAVVRLLEITHPGIVGILDFVRDTQAAAIVSRYVEGDSALDAKARQPRRCFEVEKLRPWLGQLCEALDFAWRRGGAIHGDLGPANLLITPLGDMKVADFGLARCLYDLTSTTGDPLLAMPPAFSSPERLRGEPVTVADDVFGFGATVFDLLTSKPPFPQGPTEGEAAPVMSARRAALGIGGDLIPPEWEEVIAACLAPRAGDRPRTIREAGERLGVLAPLPPEADRAPAPTVLPRPHETVVGYRPPSTRPAPVYPSSEVTAAMEPPTMHAAPTSAAAPGGQESAPATIDENLDFEETIGEAPAQPGPADDDALATIAADPTPVPFVPPPPSQPQPDADDASATVAAEPPPPAPAPPVEEELERTVTSHSPPPPAPPIPRDLEESVTMPTPLRHPTPPLAVQQAALPREAPPPIAPPTLPSKGIPRWWFIAGAAVVVVGLALPFMPRKETPPPVTEPVSAEPTPIAATPLPATPTPMPATPPPVPPPPSPTVRTIQPAELATFAGPVSEPLLLVGSYRVSTVLPAQGGHPASITMRPADAALAGRIRIVATLAPSASVPAEGSVIELGAASGYHVRQVRAGADGQINVIVEQSR
jgi:serine/threonine protein kinase